MWNVREEKERNISNVEGKLMVRVNRNIFLKGEVKESDADIEHENRGVKSWKL